jgi:hypothetical protein
LIDQQRSTLENDESAIALSHYALAKSERERKYLAEKLDQTSKALEQSEKARKDLTGEKAVGDWLPSSLESSNNKELTNKDIENYLKWSLIPERDRKSSTSQQETQTTDLPTLQLSERIGAIATMQVPSALFVAEFVNNSRQLNPSYNTGSEQTASSQRPSSPSASPRPAQEISQSRLRTEIKTNPDLMTT